VPARKRKDADIRIRISLAEKEHLGQAARSMGVSVSKLVRDAALEFANALIGTPVPEEEIDHVHE
jgi:uncharacterized protein (DUF1778 family)